MCLWIISIGALLQPGKFLRMLHDGCRNWALWCGLNEMIKFKSITIVLPMSNHFPPSSFLSVFGQIQTSSETKTVHETVLNSKLRSLSILRNGRTTSASRSSEGSLLGAFSTPQQAAQQSAAMEGPRSTTPMGVGTTRPVSVSARRIHGGRIPIGHNMH